MDKALLTIVFQGIPEMIAIIMMVLVLAEKTFEWKKGILIGVILGFLIFYIRKLPLVFGMHSLLILTMLVLIFYFIFNIEVFKTVKFILLGFLIIFLGELISFLFIKRIFKIDLAYLMENTVLWVISGWFHILLLGVFTIIYFYINNKKRGV